MFMGMTNGILLLALGAGYIVCYLAKREEGSLKTIGSILGAAIILLGAILLVNNMLMDARFCRMNKMGCAMMMPHHKMMKGNIEPIVPPGQP